MEYWAHRDRMHRSRSVYHSIFGPNAMVFLHMAYRIFMENDHPIGLVVRMLLIVHGGNRLDRNESCSESKD